MKILILVLATLIAGALCEEKCVPGTTFMEDCNRCRCSSDGQKACTRKMCPPNELSDDAQVRTEQVPNGDSLSSTDEKDEVHLQTNGQVCTPNEIKMQDCNRCRCANNGIGWFCTRRACPQREKRAAAGSNCTPNTTFMADDGCNTCHCDDDGRAACTRRACAPKDESYLIRFRREVEEIKCTPGTTFKRDCNDCFCDDQGRAACSLKFCPSEDVSAFRGRRRRATEDAPKCTPGTTFLAEDGCNTCHCNDQGRAACTRRACEPKDESYLIRLRREVAEIKCTPGTTFKRDCNDCICDDQGRAACSLKFCPSEDVSAFRGRRRRATEDAPKCTPGTTFMDDDGCNSCFCDNQGRAACTLMLCAPKDASALRGRRRRATEDAPKCTPGTTFLAEDGCNTCHCNDQGRAACTRRACEPKDESYLIRLRREVAEIKCTPGTTFKRDCNTCSCDSQGRAICTLIGCLPQREKRQTPGELPQADIAPGTPGFTCTPRSSFKYQCNTCVCTDDGKNAGCTFKFCIPGEY